MANTNSAKSATKAVPPAPATEESQPAKAIPGAHSHAKHANDAPPAAANLSLSGFLRGKGLERQSGAARPTLEGGK